MMITVLELYYLHACSLLVAVSDIVYVVTIGQFVCRVGMYDSDINVMS